MNSRAVGLNVFIAVVGISAGPGFVIRLQKLGISLFLWGIMRDLGAADPGAVCRHLSVPLRPGDPAGCLRRSRPPPPPRSALICDSAKGQVNATWLLLRDVRRREARCTTIWGMVVEISCC